MADDVSLQKRAQISKANRTMFLWIAAASVLVGAAIVVSFFMFKILIYGEKVLAAKDETASTLNHNLKTVDALKSEIRALDANEALSSVKANDRDQALQVVLDALPSEANSLALGASLQNKLLIGGEGGVTLDSIQVTPVDGVETSSLDETTVDASSTASADNSIAFQFAVKGSDAGLKGILINLERSIRTIQVTSIRIAGESGGQTMTVEGRAFYEPAKKIELREEVIPVESGKRSKNNSNKTDNKGAA